MPRQQEEKGGEGPARLPAARKGRAPEGYWRSTALVCHAAKEGRGFYSGLHHATVGKRGSGGFLHNPCLRASGFLRIPRHYASQGAAAQRFGGF